MVANPERREAILDAGLAVLGDEGARALTFRRVDAVAGLPVGTAANYLPDRATMLRALAERLFARIAPDPERVAATLERAPRAAAVALAADVAERLLAEPVLARALVELRLEAARSPEVAALVTPYLRAGLDADVAFHEGADLPGGAAAVQLLHHAITGLVLDRATTGIDGRPLREVAAELAERILP